VKIRVGARPSPLSQVQAQEVLDELRQHVPSASFEFNWIESTGDRSLNISLRTLGKTDFFTKEIDQQLLQGSCRIGIHSAKDLPEPLPKGLKMVALTRGVDAADSLVFREHDFLDTLPAGSLIATSSERREAVIKDLRPDLRFRDLRGTIQQRLKLLEQGEADGVVVAEAALIRLQLCHLNRLRLPGETAALQGQLAIIAKEDDTEMANLFQPLDSRLLPQALYIGPELPLHAFRDRRLIHSPLIEIIPRTLKDTRITHMLEKWPSFSHLIMTSKSAVKILISLLRRKKIDLTSLHEKTVIAVGTATGDVLKGFGVTPLIAEEECAEGLLPLLSAIPKQSYVLWAHSSLSRSIIDDALKQKKIPFFSCALYDIEAPACALLPDLTSIPEVLFSSPSTVSAFFTKVAKPPKHLKLTPIGPITRAFLQIRSHSSDI
jgi:hydroxymethylbilane synthase